MYVIFRLDLVGGEPVCDGDEIAGAGFFSLDEMEAMEGVQTSARGSWANLPSVRSRHASSEAPTLQPALTDETLGDDDGPGIDDAPEAVAGRLGGPGSVFGDERCMRRIHG
jgi:hypothetical protein